MVIVDDNNRDRRIIQEVIDWESYGVCIKGAASNGLEALRLVENFVPDIVLSDISMPSLNGIELAHELRSRFPGTKVIFMSWHNDFEYAKTAVNLNVCGYVMKPIVPEELADVVLNVLGICKREMLQRDAQARMLKQIEDTLPIILEEFFRELLFSQGDGLPDLMRRAEFLRIDCGGLAGVQVLLLQIEANDGRATEKNVTEQYALSFYVKEIIDSLRKDGVRYYCVRISPREFAVAVLSMDSWQFTQTQLVEAATEVYSALSGRFGVAVAAGISKPAGGIGDIPSLYTQCRVALNTKFFSKDPIILYSDIEDKTGKDSFGRKVNLAELYEEIKEAVFSNSEQEITKLSEKYLPSGSIGETGVYHKSVAFSMLNTLQIVLAESGKTAQDAFGDAATSWERLNGFGTIAELQLWCRETLTAVARCLNPKSAARDRQIVDNIKSIVQARYTGQISIDDIVDAVYISARQANKIFKRQTGLTIFDYLVDYRIQMAKALLKSPYSRIYQVAGQVGYLNKSHFCLVFKKNTGVTPAEYRYNPV
jgi:YesN/AraC family two-component response regulator